MRSYSLVAILLVAASIAVLPSYAQEDGDAVTYTRAEVIYTGILDGNLDTVSRVPISTIVDAASTVVGAADATTAAVVSEDLVWQPSPTAPVDLYDVDEDEPSRLLFIQQPLHRRNLAPEPTSFPLLKRQNQGGAALGGGGGAIITQTGLQVISGYSPPQATVPPSPVNQISGTIISASEIPGYSGVLNTDGVSSGSAKSGASSSSSKVVVAQLALGLVGGAVVFALL